MNKVKIKELKTLCELEFSILNYGKIDKDATGFMNETYEDRRLEGLFDLQDKYTYGWYIAEQTMEEQIKSINEFKKYIIEH